MKKVIFSLVLGVGMLASANASAGDAQAGKAKAATCAACHGANGIGTADMYPNLAGQHADYIVKQLKAFKDGSRKDPLMSPMAAPLSDADMADLGAYFASMNASGETAAADAGASATAVAAAPAAPKIVPDAAAGKHLYEMGDEARGITACIGCHGKDGDSLVLINPNLSNQHPEYIEKQLNHFKDGSRDNASMNQVSMNLSEQDIADLGAYFKDPEVKAVAKASGSKSVPVIVSGDVDKGKALSGTCVACHGTDGNALIAMYPKIAGQHEEYITNQLMDFKSGERADPVMAGMVAALSEEDMKNLASYFASQKMTEGSGTDNDKGRKLYLSGDASRGITACTACHGFDGSGMAKAGFPSVANQHVDYLKAQLTKFRSQDRANDSNKMMRNIAVRLKDEDIEALAQYMSSL
ncbi:hypothetical protein tloyanaT_00550 [Thalassotalea loyana]|uniref:Cytochrome c domain-containing protein n=1 Tax=Thalassotalea loyana TaxID=280483 RepID=A0ABQ6H6N4_9GAMM|nr:c-type cytochrome [Thalassotalea loyana]GLX83803.1 hypothetical protein tloyanaT_00550 [Thalassotalea loyana]